MTKYEGSYIGHTFVARLASNPKVVIDTYTLEPTRIIDCPNMKQKVTVASKEGAEREAEAVIEAQGTTVHEQHLEEEEDATTRGGASIAATAAAAGAAAAGGLSG